MKYNVLTADQQEVLGNRADLIEAATQDILLAPVLCIDCERYVPFGWVEFGTVKCANNIGGNGVQYGHRVHREVCDSVKDQVVNALAKEV